MKTLVTMMLVLFSFSAYATDKPPPKDPEPSQEQRQDQSQAQQQAQQQSQSASANNEGVSQSVEFKDRRQAPPAFAPSIAPSAPCYYSASGGLSVPGFGAAGGKAIKDEACELRENIRLAYSIGLVNEGDYLFCATIGKDIPNCGARPAPLPAAEQQPLVVVITGDSCGMSKERANRVLEKCVSK